MLAALASSGLSINAFARQHELAPQKVCYWKSRLGPQRQDFAEKPPKMAKPSSLGFVTAKLRTQPSSPTARSEDERPFEQTLVLDLGSGQTARVSGRWDASSIALWFSAAKETQC